MKNLVLLFVLLAGQFVYAKDTSALFQALRNSGEKYEVVGTVCEQVAKLQMEDEYGPKYDVVTGIEYSNGQRIVGELDVTVINKQTGNVEIIGEVKCWKDLKGALTKAKDQRARFLSNMQTNSRAISFAKDNQPYQTKQFVGAKTFITIAQEGSKDVGFDRDLGYSLDDLMALRKQLLDCQNRGECTRPR